MRFAPPRHMTTDRVLDSASDEVAIDSRYARSRALFERASHLIPGGIHLSGRALLDEAPPIYCERASGARIWDVDGNEYIDYLLAFGAFLLGYGHPEVERAAARQSAKGRL